MNDKMQKFQELGDELRSYFIYSKRFYSEELKQKNTPQQGRTLMFIEANPGVIQREIGDIFQIRNASVTNMLKNLERDGYIERRQDPKSARVKRIYITDSGKKQVALMKQNFSEILAKMSNKVDESLLDQLLPLIKELNKQIQK